MKHLTLLLFLVFVACKNETKPQGISESGDTMKIERGTESKMHKSPTEIWQNYIKSHPEFKDETLPESDFFHNNREDANRLADLTVHGKKQASSGLYKLYQQYGVDLPSIGTKQIVTDFDGNAQAIIENVSVDTIPFNKISEEYAKLDMGTNIEPLKKWKKAHWDFFESFLKESGEQPNEEMLIVCVRFKKVWPE